MARFPLVSMFHSGVARLYRQIIIIIKWLSALTHSGQHVQLRALGSGLEAVCFMQECHAAFCSNWLNTGLHAAGFMTSQSHQMWICKPGFMWTGGRLAGLWACDRAAPLVCCSAALAPAWSLFGVFSFSFHPNCSGNHSTVCLRVSHRTVSTVLVSAVCSD